MNKNTRNGLLALGVVAAAAWFKMTPEQKANVKNKINDAGKKIKDNIPQDFKNMWAKKNSPVLDDQTVNN